MGITSAFNMAQQVTAINRILIIAVDFKTQTAFRFSDVVVSADLTGLHFAETAATQERFLWSVRRGKRDHSSFPNPCLKMSSCSVSRMK
jgi:hypothetical protein